MPYIVPPEFQKLTAAEVEAALMDERPNPVIEVLALLLNAYAEECARLVRHGQDPETFLKQPPGCALEALALDITAGAVREKQGG